MQVTNRSAAATKAAETRRIRKAEEQAKYKRERYEVWDCGDFQGSYLASKYSIDDLLEICCEMVTSDEFLCPGVVVWLDGPLMAAAKRGDQGEAIVTDFSGPYPEWQRKLPACRATS